MNTVHQ